MHAGKDQFMPHVLEKRTRCTQIMHQEGVKLDQGKTHTGEKGSRKDNAALEYGP